MGMSATKSRGMSHSAWTVVTLYLLSPCGCVCVCVVCIIVPRVLQLLFAVSCLVVIPVPMSFIRVYQLTVVLL